MIFFQSIRSAYAETEYFFIRAYDDAEKKDDNNKKIEYEKFKLINDSAYFILMWGQFESFIKSKVIELEGESNIEESFMINVKMIVSPYHEYYHNIDHYYSLRCNIAHGRVNKFPELELSTIFDRIEEIVDEIQKTLLPIGDNFFDFTD